MKWIACSLSVLLLASCSGEGKRKKTRTDVAKPAEETEGADKSFVGQSLGHRIGDGLGDLVAGSCSTYVRNTASQFRYGRHWPQGLEAMQSLYDPTYGTWRRVENLSQVYNYYKWDGVERPYFGDGIPADRDATIHHASRPGVQHTCRDADGNVLFDQDDDGHKNSAGGYSFIEHGAIGAGGVRNPRHNPFNQLWFDDNYVARIAAQAAGTPLPAGLHPVNRSIRWSALEGNTQTFAPYPSPWSFPDQLALNGMRSLAVGDHGGALALANALIARINPYYDASGGVYRFHGLQEAYHVGLSKIFLDHLLDMSSLDCGSVDKVIELSMSLKTMLLEQQLVHGSWIWPTKRLGWLSTPGDTNSLANTETTAVNSMALGSMARWVFEPHWGLYQSANNYFIRPTGAFSAVTGLSRPGFMTYGPYWSFGAGEAQVDFFLRAPNPDCGALAYLDVFDATNGRVLSSVEVPSQVPLRGSMVWTKVTLQATLPADASIEFRTYWHGQCNLDVGQIRLR